MRNLTIHLERMPTPDDVWWRAVLEDGTAGEWVYADPAKAVASLAKTPRFDKAQFEA